MIDFHVVPLPILISIQLFAALIFGVVGLQLDQHHFIVTRQSTGEHQWWIEDWP